MSRPHLFSYRDILRIVRAVEPETAPESGVQETVLILSALFEIMGDAMWSLQSFPGSNISMLFLGKVAARMASLLLEMLSRTTARIRNEVWKIITFGQSETVAVELLSMEGEPNGESNGA